MTHGITFFSMGFLLKKNIEQPVLIFYDKTEPVLFLRNNRA